MKTENVRELLELITVGNDDEDLSDLFVCQESRSHEPDAHCGQCLDCKILDTIALVRADILEDLVTFVGPVPTIDDRCGFCQTPITGADIPFHADGRCMDAVGPKAS